MSLDELAALVDIPADDLRAWTELGLLDPARRGQFDELDLLRLMAIRHYVALGYTPESFAEALASGELEIRLHEYLYPRGRELSLDEAAAELDIEPDVLRSLRTALGFTRDTFLEHDLDLLRGFNAMTAAGMPFEAVLEGRASSATPCAAWRRPRRAWSTSTCTSGWRRRARTCRRS
jgi:DNA-binding transcriptional MerR regulator